MAQTDFRAEHDRRQIHGTVLTPSSVVEGALSAFLVVSDTFTTRREGFTPHVAQRDPKVVHITTFLRESDGTMF